MSKQPPLRSPVQFRFKALVAFLLVVLGAVLTVTRPTSKDYALCSLDGRIYTVDAAHPNVQCIVVSNTTITDVGSLADVQARWRTRSTIRDLLGFQIPWPLNFWLPSIPISFVEPNSIVVPGLADAHAHVLQYGAAMNLNLAGCKSKQDLQRVVHYVKSHPDILADPSRWVVGMGWDQNLWTDPQYPTADDFDSETLLRGRRIYLDRVDVHAAWVSNRVLQLMRDLPSKVDGGLIVRDASGKPTGIFVDNAMSLVPVPAPTKADLHEHFDRTMKDALCCGPDFHPRCRYRTPRDRILPGVGFRLVYMSRPDFRQGMHQLGNFLCLRLYLMGHVESDEYWGKNLTRLVDYGIAERLNLRSVKLFTDGLSARMSWTLATNAIAGALGSFGAALLEPYSDNPSTDGLMRVQPRVLSSLAKQFWRDGWQVNIHCIGDRANRVVLDIFEDILSNSEYGNAIERRPRIEHAQIMTLDDLQRVGRLQVIPSVQPTHATSDMWYAERRLGPERIRGARHGHVDQSSAPDRPVQGSCLWVPTFPVEGINPLLGFYAAVSRLSPTGDSPHGSQGWYASERLTRAQALKGMTLDAAYAAFAEDKLGSLSVGKKADFVVLDRDIMTVPFSEILATRVKATVIDGEVVYGKL
ncbi:amidohydrolase family-domain-containing protein [Chiua virens]|nr:amidohydrolase family-domain-containing protein [Chiua virens]